MKYTHEEVVARLRALGARGDAEPFTPDQLKAFDAPLTPEEQAEIEELREAAKNDPWPLEGDIVAIALGLIPDPEGRVPN
ncbi:MAG TPA: hypothetical protein VFS13_08055 [Steroidobacteraceae bacterium]|nr:hypothetical protein [Steroidobacteraceae bacterium]